MKNIHFLRFNRLLAIICLMTLFIPGQVLATEEESLAVYVEPVDFFLDDGLAFMSRCTATFGKCSCSGTFCYSTRDLAKCEDGDEVTTCLALSEGGCICHTVPISD